MIYDCFTFNGEYDLLEVRLNVLDEYVDQFIICEAPTTFSGKEKPLYYEQQKERYSKWAAKIKYFVIDENYSEEERAQAAASPNTAGADHWKHEFLQKESIKKALAHLNDDDICFIGDCDEIWKPVDEIGDGVYKLSAKVYVYSFNNRSDEPWHGTIVSKYRNIKDSCLNHLRSHKDLYIETENDGWHFTSLQDILRRKLEDSYTEDSYATPWVMENLDENIAYNKDFLGRAFTFWTDESELPKYLIDNKEKYGHLFK
jgi:beta-1,4-mannosyl-glycoprotein beta-1,4-N-acetylglucosaminyltransferase